MALDDVYTINRPGQANATGAVDALHIEELVDGVEGTLNRRSAMAGFVPVRSVRGTSVLQKFAHGKSTLQKITPGNPIDGTVSKFGKATLTIDTTLIAREVLPNLEVFQTSYDARQEIALEHGKEMAKQYDEAFFIQATKAGLATATKYGITSAGHLGGSQVTLAAAGDKSDPAKLYQAILDLLTLMRKKDVDPIMDNVIIAVDPTEFATLIQNEVVINGQYLNSEGTSIEAQLLKGHGVPIVQSNNYIAGKVISGNLLSNAANSNAYDGDFTKIVATAFSPRALLAGETIPLTGDVFFDKLTKQWFVDAWRAYGVTTDRHEFAGVIQLP